MKLKRFLLRLPAPLRMLLGHILALALALVVFAYFHHVRSYSLTAVGTTSSRYAMAAATSVPSEPTAEPAPAIEDTGSAAASPTDTAEPLPEPTEAPAAVGDFSARFADRFVSGEPQITDTSYVSSNISITITPTVAENQCFYVADIYIRDISCFRTAFAGDTYGRGITENILDVSSRNGSVLTINGDYYGTRTGGACVRNGVLYLDDNVIRDLCVLYWDGTMKCYPKEDGKVDIDAEMAKGAYQIWNFGPSLLNEDGSAKTDFASIYDDVGDRHPRSALGYIEPGHYVFVTVDGRRADAKGMNFSQLSSLFKRLGCVAAYGMDGGKTAQMVFNGRLLNTPYKGGRDCSDYLCILDSVDA